MSEPPRFDDSFRERLRDLLVWRRDVRRFRREPPPAVLLDRLLGLAHLAPSVGLSQPWRFVTVDDPDRRRAVRAVFANCNRTALDAYDGEQARLYATLKLAGLDEAPWHIAVFSDHGTGQGAGLGRRTMPEMTEYSVVTAIHTLWLAARAEGVGMGWVSILDPPEVAAALDVPADWVFVAYLCLGYPAEEIASPTLEREGWEHRRPVEELVIRR